MRKRIDKVEKDRKRSYFRVQQETEGERGRRREKGKRWVGKDKRWSS